MPDDHHGVRVSEVNDGTRSMRTVDTAVSRQGVRRDESDARANALDF